MPQRSRLMRGQSITEYAMLLAMVGIAVFTIQTVVSRSLMGKYRSGMNVLADITGTGDFAKFTKVEQYAPYDPSGDRKRQSATSYTEDYEVTKGTVSRVGSLTKTIIQTGSKDETGDATKLTEDDGWK